MLHVWDKALISLDQESLPNLELPCSVIVILGNVDSRQLQEFLGFGTKYCISFS